MKKIILPTDFSENARHTLDYAVKMFEPEAIEFLLIHSYDLPAAPALVTSTKLLENIRKDSISDLEKEKEYLSSILSNKESQISTLSERGSITNVLNAGQYTQSDMILIGSQGVGATIDFRLGSNTLSVMKNVNIPILVIPKTENHQPFKKIVYASDLIGLSDDSILDPILRILDKNDAIIEVAHISEESTPEKHSRMDELVKLFGEGRARQKFFKTDNVTTGLNDLVEETNPDLLIMVNRRKSFFTRIFNPSMTKKMVISTSLPIMVLHDVE